MQGAERRTFRKDIGELRRMSTWWREWAARAGLSGETAYGGEVCLNEAVGNIIQHGGDDQTPHAIQVTLEPSTDAVRMTIVDDFRPFDPLQHPASDSPQSLTEAPIGGRGIPLLRTYASELRYRRDQGQNELIMIFSRKSLS
jgi:anti-sigma regulatory factor (Ser/Thr protein kinase)